MNQFRILVIALAFLIGGPFLVYRGLTEPPALEKLQKVSGIVQFDIEVKKTRRTTQSYPVFIVGNAPIRYKYMDWFPRSSDITSLVQSGENVTIWSDRGANDWIWQIEQNGNLVVPYSEIRDKIVSNNRFEALVGGGLFIVGIILSVVFYRQIAQ